jgi:choline transport protein
MTQSLQRLTFFQGLVVFGSNYAFQAIVSLGGVAIQIGYLTPVLMVRALLAILIPCMFRNTNQAFDKLIIRGRSALPPSQYFNLGKFGLVVNITSVCWSSLIIVILL